MAYIDLFIFITITIIIIRTNNIRANYPKLSIMTNAKSETANNSICFCKVLIFNYIQ